MPERALPTLTHLHYLVLGVLRTEEQPGRILRQALASYGVLCRLATMADAGEPTWPGNRFRAMPTA